MRRFTKPASALADRRAHRRAGRRLVDGGTVASFGLRVRGRVRLPALRKTPSHVPLQNRVTPFGDIVAIPERGLVYGNRGIIHDDQRRIVRLWQVRRWIACRLQFKDW